MAGGSNGPPELNGSQVVFPTKTLAELRADIYARLGFIDPFANAPTRTLATIRTSITQTLGFPEALPFAATRTLAQMRESVIARAGYAVQAESGLLPPGMETLVDDTINEAQQTVFRRIEMDRGGLVSYPTRMSADSDTTDGTLDYHPTLYLSIALIKSYYGKADAKAYFDMYERFLSDHARTKPPNLDDTLADLIKEAQTDVYSLSAFSLTTDSTTIDYRPIQALATARAKALYGQKDAQVYFEQYERMMADTLRRFPPTAYTVVTQALADAQRQIYWRYPMLRTEKWFSWETVVGQRFYDIPKVSSDTLDLRRITWVGVQQDQTWLPLHAGIDPERFTETGQGVPQCYEFREFLEIWPEPDRDDYVIWMKGHIGLQSFEEDTDTTTTDYLPVFLMALANCKQHFQQPDAPSIFRQLEVMIGKLNAGTFGLQRYVPTPPEPIRNDYARTRPMPRVTFPRN
jgi:hypothetical protein